MIEVHQNVIKSNTPTHIVIDFIRTIRYWEREVNHGRIRMNFQL